MFLRKITLMFCLFLCFSSIFAQTAGTNSFEFLRTQYSPRGAAMGGNLVAVKQDIQSILYNPATLSGNGNRQWSLNYVDHLLDFQAGHLAIALPMTDLSNLHINLIYFNYGSFDETDEFGDATGRTFSASEFALSAGISSSLGLGFDYGIATKFFFSNIDEYNASGIAFDAGLLYTIPALDNLQLGISLLNFGKTLENYTDVQEKLPLMLRFGFAKRLAHLPLLFTGSLNDITEKEDKILDRFKKFAVGGEFDISNVIKFRLGYQNIINQSVKPLGRNVLSGISLGLGINWRNLRLDYSYSNFGDLGSQNRLGVMGQF
jgi:hypothetical protein